jgi:hypothetical protein
VPREGRAGAFGAVRREGRRADQVGIQLHLRMQTGPRERLTCARAAGSSSASALSAATASSPATP